MKEVRAEPESLHWRGESGREERLPWSEVFAVSVSQVGIKEAGILVTYLTFDLEYGEYIEVSDVVPGWQGLVEALPERLPIPAPVLEMALRTVPLQTEPIVIYKR